MATVYHPDGLLGAVDYGVWRLADARVSDVVSLVELVLDVLGTVRQVADGVPAEAAVEAIRRILVCLDDVIEKHGDILAARREIARIVADAYVGSAT